MTTTAKPYSQIKVIILPPAEWRDDTLYILDQDIRFSYKRKQTKYDLVVPRGFVSDGGTIPRWLWPLFPPAGEYFVAAVIHDFALKQGYSWDEALDIFDSALGLVSMPSWRRHALVFGVRVYGYYKDVKRWLKKFL